MRKPREIKKFRFVYIRSRKILVSADENLIYHLIPTRKEDLVKLRLKHHKRILILKDDEDFFTVDQEYVSTIGDIVLSDKSHKCTLCGNFFKCPKVSDRGLFYKQDPTDSVVEEQPSKITMQLYKESKRLEKYSFINLGVETSSRFVVWECDKFFNSEMDKM